MTMMGATQVNRTPPAGAYAHNCSGRRCRRSKFGENCTRGEILHMLHPVNAAVVHQSGKNDCASLAEPMLLSQVCRFTNYRSQRGLGLLVFFNFLSDFYCYYCGEVKIDDLLLLSPPNYLVLK